MGRGNMKREVNNQIKEFLFSANTQGYGSADVNEEKLPNGEHIIRFSDDTFEI